MYVVQFRVCSVHGVFIASALELQVAVPSGIENETQVLGLPLLLLE
jgi:hypothetical protein